MKPEILDIIRCTCGRGDFSLRVTGCKDHDIIEGAVLCSHCQKEFKITSGILDMVSGAASREDETRGWASFAGKEGWLSPNPVYLSSLPFPASKNFHPGDTLTWERHGRNFFRTLAHLDLNAKRVLDLGAGRCWTTKYLALMNARCVATDLVVENNIGLQTGAFYMQESLVYFDRVRCDMHCLPFCDASFDIVLAQGSIHHSSNLRASIFEASRVLKEGGQLVLTNESCSEPNGLERLEVKDMPGIHEHNYRGYHQLKWFVQAGFGNFEVIPDAYFYRRDDPYYVPFSDWGRIHPLFISLKLLWYGGVYNLIAVKK